MYKESYNIHQNPQFSISHFLLVAYYNVRTKKGGISVYRHVIIINSDTLGRGDEGVGQTLLGTFLRKSLASINKPDVIIFYNSGVKLLTRQSFFLDVLDGLERSGVELLACGTCVYKVCGQKSLAVGRISNMDEITDVLMNAERVTTL